MAVLESYRMAEKQFRWLARILPSTWELIFIDDGSSPQIPFPVVHPPAFQFLRTNPRRKLNEWTQKAAINLGVELARGHYLVKNDIDHIFTPEAIQAADRFQGDMMLFHRSAGVLTDDLRIVEVDHKVFSLVDDIYVIKKSLFNARGGYPHTRLYGDGGKTFWEYSQKPEAQPPEGALVYVAPDSHEQYHKLPRVSPWV